MWFKNLVAYRLPADWSLTAAELEELLVRRTLQPCPPFEMQSRGWVPPSPTGAFVHTVNRQHMIALGVDQKLLPGSIVRQVTAERAAAQAQEQGFPVARRQLHDLKMRVTEELRARALSRRRVIRAWIDPVNGWFVVDVASIAKAEELVETLRETLGGRFAVELPQLSRSPQQAMSLWLAHGDAPAGFTIDQDLELQSADPQRSTVRYTRHPLDVREVQGHLKAGKYPLRLGLTWADRIAFVLTDKFQVKRLEFLEVSKERGGAEELDPAAEFDADFTVMAGELAKLLADLSEALGGDALQQAAA
jgi:recombination associated protein RdgC